MTRGVVIGQGGGGYDRKGVKRKREGERKSSVLPQTAVGGNPPPSGDPMHGRCRRDPRPAGSRHLKADADYTWMSLMSIGGYDDCR